MMLKVITASQARKIREEAKKPLGYTEKDPGPEVKAARIKVAKLLPGFYKQIAAEARFRNEVNLFFPEESHSDYICAAILKGIFKDDGYEVSNAGIVTVGKFKGQYLICISF